MLMIHQCLPPSTRMAQPHSFTLDFHKMGMDIVEKLLTALGQRIFMLVVTNYFTKWIEVEAFYRYVI